MGFVDADMSTPISEVDKLLGALAGGAQVAIGSWAMPGSTIDRHQPWWRENAGKLFSLLTHLSLLPGIYDSQCGCKFFTHPVAGEIFRRQRLSGWAFDAELLYVARRLEYQIAQISVRWADDPKSKVRMVCDGPQMLIDVARIRALHHGLKPATDYENLHPSQHLIWR